MHDQGFFYQAFVYLAAAVIAVPVAKRLGLGSVLGYLIAGILIGPFGLEFLGEEGESVMHFAEFGVVMMLFIVGLELEPALLWRMRGPVLGLGGAQVLVTTLILTLIAKALGQPLEVSLAIGMTLALSSTAIVLQTLNEKGLMKTAGGQNSFSVLLFQDIAVIPMLALLPLLATGGSVALSEHSDSLIDGLPAWAQTLTVLGVLTGIVLVGPFLLTPIFRFVAKARLRETFTATSLFLVIGTALLMTELGLSPALGTFVAGVTLATNEYRHELEAEIEPFKGLLLGLFFISVGASINFALVLEDPLKIAALVLGLITVKFLVLLALGKAFRLGLDQNTLFAVALAQGGEFAFVLFSFATDHRVIPEEVAAPLTAAVALSMALTPLGMIVTERLILPHVGTRQVDEREHDAVHEDNPVIVAGIGRFGQISSRLLRSAGFECTLLDVDSDQVDLVRKFGNRVYYGDATRADLLRSAGAEQAKVILITIDQPEKAVELIGTCKKNFPNLKILARAYGRGNAFELIDAGADHVYRELFDSSLQMGRDALRELGMRAYRADRAMRSFRRQDEEILRDTLQHRHDEKNYLDFMRNRIDNLEEVLRKEYEQQKSEQTAWDTQTLQREIRAATPEPTKREEQG